ncbi:hypothetical protein L2719_00195 [Shewanella schlegeliana]|uniref:Lipoprotein n=1 Tax=Shewanella schlegeliana TaxID=190308 RepID=A0ABS1SVI1_9GAMM|nr:hypothetical protein [Shewanella schlegeliana]MBL4912551.1 hypothetical protein [Shewanella schlegeliana]MCL1107979.1 hypothetical protein [Shewanella schlegeliana]
MNYYSLTSRSDFEKSLLTLASCLSITALMGCNSDSVQEPLGKQIEPSACFWVGPYNIDHPERNFAYPDTGANYWHAGYILPEGASLTLHGEYPYARYISLNSYRADTSPATAITDKDIVADDGSFNPYIQGAERQKLLREFTLAVAQGQPAGELPSNTLFDYAEQGNKAVLIYRIYVNDEGQDEQGGVELPAVELTLSSGEQLYGQQACDALQVDSDNLAIPLVPKETYGKIRLNPAFDPAKNPAVWRAAYNGAFGIQCNFLGNCDGEPERKVNYYANADNQYVSTFLNSDFGEVAVTRGKLPKVPKTLAGEGVFDESESQLRYWSICQNEYYSQRVTACLFDEELVVDEDGYYTVVTSPDVTKPSNANAECGYNYLPWTEQGDGFGRVEGGENKLNEALLIVRNMLPKADFAEAIQNTSVPGDEYAIMGEYLPTTEYMSQADFEALGCEI